MNDYLKNLRNQIETYRRAVGTTRDEDLRQKLTALISQMEHDAESEEEWLRQIAELKLKTPKT